MELFIHVTTKLGDYIMATNVAQFKNDIDQLINPGDDVVIVTTGYGHQVRTKKGTYVGIHENGGVQCIVKERRSFWVFKTTRERVTASFFSERNQKLSAFAASYRAETGKFDYYNQPEYNNINSEYQDQIEIEYEGFDRRTTLQRNRVYKLAA